MRIEELSVGDWVQDKKGTKAQILGIENWSDGYELNVRLKGVDVGNTPATSAHPIPLTPEILEMNGWRNDKADRNFFATDEVYIYNHEGVWRLRPKSPELLIVVDIKHVHQLQRALRLLGVEKEIEL